MLQLHRTPWNGEQVRHNLKAEMIEFLRDSDPALPPLALALPGELLINPVKPIPKVVSTIMMLGTLSEIAAWADCTFSTTRR